MVKTKRRIKSVISLLMAVLCMTFICVTANAALNVNWMRNVLAADNTWFNETTAGISRSAVTEIDFATAAPASYTKSWNADAGDTGAVKCYLNGTVVTVVGDGANGVYAHKDSTSTIFSGFTRATTITGLNLLHLDNVAGQTVILPSIDVTLYQFLGWSTSNLEWIPERTAADAAIAATSNSYSGVQTNLYAVMKLLNKCEITGNPSDKTTVYNESTATLTVSAVGGTGATMSYQWQESTDGGNSWSDVVGATSDSYTTPISKNAGVYQYRCVVKSTLAGDVKTATSDAATVTINKANSIISFVTSSGTITATTGQSNVSTNIALQKGSTPITIGTISDNGAGTVSVSAIANNSDNKIAVTATGGTVKVTPLKQTETGAHAPSPVVLTISVPEGANYKAASMKVNVYVTEKPNVNVSYNTTTYTSSNVVMTVDAKAFLSDVTGITIPQDITDVYLMIGGAKISFFDNKIGTKYTYTFTENGKGALYVCDNYGGIYTENVNVDWIDKTPPTAPTITAKQGTTARTSGDWSNGNVTVSISGGTAYSGIANYKYQLNGGTWTVGNSVTISTEGIHTIKAKAVSNSGLETTEASVFVVNVDTTKPSLTINGNPTSWAYAPTLTVVPSDDASGIKKVYFKNGTVEEEMISPYQKTITANGIYTFGVIDVAGNRAESSVTVTLVDHAAPTVPTITAKQGTTNKASDTWSNGDVTITISGGSAASGIASYKYQLDGGTWTAGNTFTISTDGTHTIKAKAVSTVGQESVETSVFTVKLDKAPPTLTISGNPTTWAYDATLTLVPADTGTSGISKVYYKNGSAEEAMSPPYQKSITANGTYTFGVIDVAGNRTETSANVTFIDRAVPNAPTIACKVGSATIVSGQWINNGSAILTFSAESNIPSGISGYRYSLDGGTTWTNGASVTVSDEGKYTVKAKTISTTGIESPESTFSLCIDKTKPAFALTKSETGYTSNDVTVAIKFTDNLSGIKNGASSYEVTYASGDTGHSDYATWVEDGEIKLSVDIDAVLAQNGTVAVNVVDNAGNSASGSIKVENIDKTPPETPIITAKQGSSRTIEHNGWANGTVTLTFTGDYTNLSGVGSYKYSLDGGIGWISTTGNSIVIDSEGLHSIIVKAVSNTGIDSAPTAPFAFGIDLTDPTVSLSGNPTSWVQSATITATPADTGGSGVAKVFYYDALNNPIELEAPFTHVFTENGTYTFEVRDVSGNIGTKTVSITKVDSEDPVINDGLPRIVEIASGRSFAIIHLLISDQGPSGIASVTLPDGSVTANTEVNHKVYGNGDYKVMSVDNAGNTAERTVHVSGLIMSNDTSLSAAIYTENAADTCSLANGENHLFTIDANGSENAELELAALDPGAKIVSINNVAVNTAKHTATFSLPADEERLFTVVVEAADGTTDIYDITVSAKNLAPQIVSIVNGTNIRKSWYTEEGIVLDHNYTKYQAGHEGIEIQITAFDANRGQYISGYVTFNGINYDIEWGSAGSGVREFVSQGKERKGYVIIPVRAFYTGTDDEDLSNTYAYITLQDAKSSGGDRISTSDSHNNNVRIRTDVTGPVVIIKSASTKYAIRVGLSDTTYINSAAVTLTPKNGPNAGIPSTTEYSHSELTSDYIYLEDGINYDITVTAVDVAGHSTTVDRTIGYMGGVANIGGDDIPGGGGDIPGGEPEEQPINSPIVVDFANTSGNVYRYKTRRANYVLIGGSGNSNAKVITPSENFALLARDILGN